MAAEPRFTAEAIQVLQDLLNKGLRDLAAQILVGTKVDVPDTIMLSLRRLELYYGTIVLWPAVGWYGPLWAALGATP